MFFVWIPAFWRRRRCPGNYNACAVFRCSNMAASSSEESLSSLCREAEQLKVKIDEEKKKFCDTQREFEFS